MIVVSSSAMAGTVLSLSMTVIVAQNRRSKYCFGKSAFKETFKCHSCTLWRLDITSVEGEEGEGEEGEEEEEKEKGEGENKSNKKCLATAVINTTKKDDQNASNIWLRDWLCKLVIWLCYPSHFSHSLCTSRK